MERRDFPFEGCTWVELTEASPNVKTLIHVIWLLFDQSSQFCLDFMRKNIAIHSWIILADDEPPASPSSSESADSLTVVLGKSDSQADDATSPSVVIRLGYGMFDGFTGIVLDPLKGVREDGVKGFFKVMNCVLSSS